MQYKEFRANTDFITDSKMQTNNKSAKTQENPKCLVTKLNCEHNSAHLFGGVFCESCFFCIFYFSLFKRTRFVVAAAASACNGRIFFLIFDPFTCSLTLTLARSFARSCAKKEQ